MSKDQALICPICQLYLHPGVSLIQHLNTHSKERVVELLWNLDVERRAATPAQADARQPPPAPTCSPGPEAALRPDARLIEVEGPAAPRDCDTSAAGGGGGLGAEELSENFENIIIVIILVAVVILYLKM